MNTNPYCECRHPDRRRRGHYRHLLRALRGLLRSAARVRRAHADCPNPGCLVLEELAPLEYLARHFRSTLGGDCPARAGRAGVGDGALP